ncbi:MAG: hypothetical protein PF638_11220 [Candidatus Delongbacteria bacterium]|jgi:hypothetical protein|nr:hypothetical protein [Candidatus Delongbacteria bacterium]
MRIITRMILFPFHQSILPMVAIAGASLGLNVLSSSFNFLTGAAEGSDQLDRQNAGYKAQQMQATSDAATARQNAGILRTQRDAFIRQQGQVMEEIQTTGDTAGADRFALAAAEGFSSGGSARGAQGQIKRNVKRDINRVRDSLASQTDIFNQQINQKNTQATAFDKQATFAGEQVQDTSFQFFKPSTWF